ncbi:cell division-specific peptidoglycan biosynthesis regulator FtsW [Bacillus oleivorans]|uniref:Probable peptidoglycan glycosyltransferase FtsW n=2 Tax=Bacillus oleivorans TaxID=1448271 RepID=A0A285D0F3_9BACI|nr:cell division-specific peptidoglycan biosynthesis regulator FtsW [Bacillus oleivorans]
MLSDGVDYMLKNVLKSYDYSIVIVYILLCFFGLVMIYSSSIVWAVQQLDPPRPSDYFYQRQKIHIILSFIAFFFAAIFPYKLFQNKKVLAFIMLGSLISLSALFLFGQVYNNAQSWFQVGARSIQPSEFAKLGIIIYLAAVYGKKQSYINDFNKGVVPPLLYLLLVCFLVMVQPDFGTAAIIFMIGAFMIICSGMNIKSLAKLFLLGVTLILLISPFILMNKDEIFSEERLGRVEGFLDPFSDVQDDGYHLVNSYFAIGLGGLTGKGLGESTQKLGFLPEPHTDFIIAIISEELGIFGVGFVILSLGFIVLRGIRISTKCKDPFGSLLAIGISSMIGIQSFINLGGASGLIPITGVPLPFISYGGSSLLLLSLSLGLLVNVSCFTNYERRYKEKKDLPAAEEGQNQKFYTISGNGRMMNR